VCPEKKLKANTFKQVFKLNVSILIKHKRALARGRVFFSPQADRGKQNMNSKTSPTMPITGCKIEKMKK